MGAKTQFWDRRVTLNLTGFWTEIRDYQALVNDGQNSTLRGYLANAGKVRVRGVEADFLGTAERSLQPLHQQRLLQHQVRRLHQRAMPARIVRR
ncbi:TonB-dependent receptor domain-containing protein [Sphingomonas sp. MMS24-JH45]